MIKVRDIILIILIYSIPNLAFAQKNIEKLMFPDELQIELDRPFDCHTPSFLDIYKHNLTMSKLLRFIELVDFELLESLLMQVSVINICVTSNLQVFLDKNDILPNQKTDFLKLELFQLGIRYGDSVLIAESNFRNLDDESKAFFFFHELLHSYFKPSALKMVRLRTFVKEVARQFYSFWTEHEQSDGPDSKNFNVAYYKSQFEKAKSENSIQVNYFRRTNNSLSQDFSKLLLGKDSNLDQKLFFGSWDRFTLWLTVNLQNQPMLDYMVENLIYKMPKTKQAFFSDLWEVFFFPNRNQFCRQQYFDLISLTEKICRQDSLIAPDQSLNEKALAYLISTMETHSERVKAFAIVQFVIKPTRFSSKTEQKIFTQIMGTLFGGSSVELGRYLDHHVEEFYAFLNSQEEYSIDLDFISFRQMVHKEGSLKILRRISHRQKISIGL